MPQPEANGPKPGGPPQHWLDLVREKAPELLSLPKHEPKSMQTADVPPAGIERPDLQESQEPQPGVIRKSQAKPLLLKYAKLPSTLRNRTVAKAKSLARSSFVTRTHSRKSEEQPPQRQEAPTRVDAESEVQKGVSTKTTRRKVDLQMPPVARGRSERRASILAPAEYSRSDKTMVRGEADSIFAQRERRDVGPIYSSTLDYPHRSAPRPDQQDSSEPIQRQPTKPKVHMSPPDPTVRHRHAGDSTEIYASRGESSETQSFQVGPAKDTPGFPSPRVESRSFIADGQINQRIISVVTPAQDAAIQQPPTSPGFKLEDKEPARLVPTFIEPSSQRPHYRRDHFERADVNLPALLNEATMDHAAAAQWSQSVSDENPWPDLPSPSPLEIEDDLSAFTREADHYRRLEREQRGTLWNE